MLVHVVATLRFLHYYTPRAFSVLSIRMFQAEIIVLLACVILLVSMVIPFDFSPNHPNGEEMRSGHIKTVFVVFGCASRWIKDVEDI